ncbi:hypothetical protein LguiB_010517 [Lonicera macranthoides]
MLRAVLSTLLRHTRSRLNIFSIEIPKTSPPEKDLKEKIYFPKIRFPLFLHASVKEIEA